MAEAATKLPVARARSESQRETTLQSWHPFQFLRREIDRAFDEFNGGSWNDPFRWGTSGTESFWRHQLDFTSIPAVDVAEKETAYEITVELPGIDEKDIEVECACPGAATH
jgi:HSP20 family protein